MTDTTTMSDIRLRPRSLLIGIAGWLLVTYLLVRQPAAGDDGGAPTLAECTRQLADARRAAAANGGGAHQPATGATIIYAITPTYARPVQKAELTR